MTPAKREWWEKFKATLSLTPKPQVASQAPVISRGVSRDDGHGTTNEPAPAGRGGPRIIERGGFYVDQLVREVRWPQRVGKVIGISDLSFAIKRDDPAGTRDFALRVLLEGRRSPDWANAARYKPLDTH